MYLVSPQQLQFFSSSLNTACCAPFPTVHYPVCSSPLCNVLQTDLTAWMEIIKNLPLVYYQKTDAYIDLYLESPVGLCRKSG